MHQLPCSHNGQVVYQANLKPGQLGGTCGQIRHAHFREFSYGILVLCLDRIFRYRGSFKWDGGYLQCRTRQGEFAVKTIRAASQFFRECIQGEGDDI